MHLHRHTVRLPAIALVIGAAYLVPGAASSGAAALPKAAPHLPAPVVVGTPRIDGPDARRRHRGRPRSPVARARPPRRRPAAELRGGVRVERPVRRRRARAGPAADTTATPFAARRYVVGPRRHRPPAAAHRDRDRGRRDRPGDVRLPGRARLGERDRRHPRARLPRRPRAHEPVHQRHARAPHGLGRGVLRHLAPALQRRRRRARGELPHRCAPVAPAARLEPGLHRHAAARPAPRGRAHVERRRLERAVVPLAGGAAAGPGRLRAPQGRRVLVSAPPRPHRPADAVGLADRPGDAARAHRIRRGGHLRHRRLPHHPRRGHGAAHELAGQHPRPPQGGLLPRPRVGGLPARRELASARRPVPGLDARQGLLRLSRRSAGSTCASSMRSSR